MLRIRHWPDPILSKKAEPVAKFGPELSEFVDKMIQTMNKENGVGLAAPQVGRSERIMVVSSPESGVIVMINPTVVTSGDEYSIQEGCLSFPEMSAPVTRPRNVEVEYFDVDGNVHSLSATGFLARVIQHEYDHIEGMVYTDRLNQKQLKSVKKQMDRLERRMNRRKP